jgi:putative MATE family efflux protein
MKLRTAPAGRLHALMALVRQSLKDEAYDYTRGSLRKAIVLLAIPMILELSLESVFAVVDMFFVGRLGDVAIATVGLTESVVTLVYGTAIGLSTAVTAVVARRTGEKDAHAAAQAAAQGILLALGITLVISLAGIFFAADVLRLMGARPEVVATGTPFARIMLGGSVVIILLFLINGIFRGAGNAAIAMRSLWLASLSNIVLCPLFIYGLGGWEGWGLKGAAIATTAGRGIGVAYQLYYLWKGAGEIRIRADHLRPDWPLIRTLATLAWPATGQFLIASGSWIVLAWLVSTTGGTDASAGYQIAIRNVVFFILPAWGLSNAAATLVGQNLGAGLPERAERSALLTARYNVFFMAGVTVILLLFAPSIVGIFSPDPSVQRTGTQALRIISTGYVFYGIGMVMMQSLNGAGDTRTPTLINLGGFWLFQIPLALLLAKVAGLGATGAFVAIPVAETAIALTAVVLFRRGHWKRVQV